MALKFNSSKSPISEINITPFVDVVLVILIVFMVCAPLMLNNIDLSLPRTKKVAKMNLKTENIVLSINKLGDYYIGKNKVMHQEIIPLLKEQVKEHKDGVVYLRAHFSLPYGKIAHILSYLKSNGLSKVSLVTEQEK